MLQYVENFIEWLFPIDTRTTFEKLADDVIDHVETSQPQNPDCEKVGKLIDVLQQWSIKHCPILREGVK
jgi:hypothetical protein